ncbi:MAG: Tol-Pal system protein TolB, partial [Rhodospirillales bacterium 12-54-5]
MFIFLVLGVAMMAAPAAYAQLKIDITKGNTEPLPIAITGLTGTDTSGVGATIASVVSADLERSGLFRPISPQAFIEHVTNGDAIPRFADWRQISAQAIMTGTITQISADKIRVSFRLWDPTAQQQVAGKEYNTSTRRIKRLAIMDQDGENHKYLTDGGALVLTPRFSPNTQQILYMSYAGSQPRVFLRDLQTGREESMGKFTGISFAPRFNFDGTKMLMSIANGGTTNIYEMDLRNREMRRITNASGVIDTSPSYSPDGQHITFSSDRGGSPQIYVMDANGGNIQRVSFGSGEYNTPVWSPRGDLIAFTKNYGGK